MECGVLKTTPQPPSTNPSPQKAHFGLPLINVNPEDINIYISQLAQEIMVYIVIIIYSKKLIVKWEGDEEEEKP